MINEIRKEGRPQFSFPAPTALFRLQRNYLEEIIFIRDEILYINYIWGR
jgi:hypothetical protein